MLYCRTLLEYFIENQKLLLHIVFFYAYFVTASKNFRVRRAVWSRLLVSKSTYRGRKKNENLNVYFIFFLTLFFFLCRKQQRSFVFKPKTLGGSIKYPDESSSSNARKEITEVGITQHVADFALKSVVSDYHLAYFQT